jgi:hypothetical protein
MSERTNSTRRSFLKRGVLLAAPFAAPTPAVVLSDDGMKARLARLEDEAAIRELHQSWLRKVSARKAEAAAQLFVHSVVSDESVRSIAADHSGAPDAIEVAPDGNRATGRFHCVADIETIIPKDCTLAQMAHEQGGGFVGRTERRLLKVEYVKISGAWAIAKVEFALV